MNICGMEANKGTLEIKGEGAVWQMPVQMYRGRPRSRKRQGKMKAISYGIFDTMISVKESRRELKIDLKTWQLPRQWDVHICKEIHEGVHK